MIESLFKAYLLGEITKMKFTKNQWMTAGLGLLLVCLMMIAINKIDAVEEIAEKIGIVK